MPKTSVYKIWKRNPQAKIMAYGINIPKEIAESFDEDDRFIIAREGNTIVFKLVKIIEVSDAL